MTSMRIRKAVTMVTCMKGQKHTFHQLIIKVINLALEINITITILFITIARAAVAAAGTEVILATFLSHGRSEFLLFLAFCLRLLLLLLPSSLTLLTS